MPICRLSKVLNVGHKPVAIAFTRSGRWLVTMIQMRNQSFGGGIGFILLNVSARAKIHLRIACSVAMTLSHAMRHDVSQLARSESPIRMQV
jgi:hypothetical protein